jgi:hypothetical protein
MDLVKAIAPFFCVLAVFWVAARLAVSDAAKGRTVRERGDGAIEFHVNRQNFWGVYVILSLTSYPVLVFVLSGFQAAFGLWLVSLCSGCVLLLLMSFPGTIVVNDKGLKQSYFVGRPRQIQWKQVAWIITDKKKKTVTIKGLHGTKVVHTRQLPDKARFLAELQTHCPAKMPAEAELKTLIGV